MPRTRDIKLSDFNISRAKYNELKYFCMQYGEKKEKVAAGYGTKTILNDGMPKGTAPGDPTAEMAVRRAALKADVDLIEDTVKEAAPGIHPWLLKNVTEGIPYEWMDVPSGRRQFYELRRYFFYLLAQKR